MGDLRGSGHQITLTSHDKSAKLETETPLFTPKSSKFYPIPVIYPPSFNINKTCHDARLIELKETQGPNTGFQQLLRRLRCDRVRVVLARVPLPARDSALPSIWWIGTGLSPDFADDCPRSRGVSEYGVLRVYCRQASDHAPPPINGLVGLAMYSIADVVVHNSHANFS